MKVEIDIPIKVLEKALHGEKTKFQLLVDVVGDMDPEEKLSSLYYLSKEILKYDSKHLRRSSLTAGLDIDGILDNISEFERNMDS